MTDLLDIQEFESLCECVKHNLHKYYQNSGFRHYCVILKHKGKINWKNKIACGSSVDYLKYKNMPARHAEMDALNKVSTWKNVPNCVDLLVIRFSKSGLLSESRPCMHCIYFLQNSKLIIKNVYYSNSNGKITKEKFNNMLNSPLTYISSGIRYLNLKNEKKKQSKKLKY